MTQPDELLKAAEEFCNERAKDDPDYAFVRNGEHNAYLRGAAHASAGWAEKLRERDEKIKSFERGLSEYRTEVTRLTKKWESSESSWDRHAAKLEAQLKLADELADLIERQMPVESKLFIDDAAKRRCPLGQTMLALAAFRKARSA